MAGYGWNLEMAAMLSLLLCKCGCEEASLRAQCTGVHSLRPTTEGSKAVDGGTSAVEPIDGRHAPAGGVSMISSSSLNRICTSARRVHGFTA